MLQGDTRKFAKLYKHEKVPLCFPYSNSDGNKNLPLGEIFTEVPLWVCHINGDIS